MYANHGGGCCGVKHLFSLDYMSLEEFDRSCAEHFVVVNPNRILEVILSERQTRVVETDRRFDRSIIDAGGWPAVLAARDFKLAETWRNSNTNNMCYRFVKLAGEGFSPAPAWWTDEPLTFYAPSPVERVIRPPVLVDGDTIRHGEFGQGEVVSIRGDRVQCRFPAPRGITTVPRAEVVKVVFEESMPYPINPDLPTEIYFPDGHIVPVLDARAHGPDNVLTDYGRFHRDTGEFGERTEITIGRHRGGRLRNTARIVGRPTANPDIEPRVVLTEYFAIFQNGNIRGPFASQEAVREAYPRVLSFRARRVFSDGTTRSDPPVRF